jgi:multidrug efflux system outer membrane protein
MSTRAPWCAWIAACAVVVPASARAQERSAQEIVDAIVRDGPRAAAIRAEVEVVRREQAARLALPNPTASYTREGAGFTEFLQIEQTLPFFGVRRSLARAGVSATAAAEADRDARLWQLRADAARLVSRTQAAQLRAAAAADALAAIERVLRLIRIREQEGEGSRFDRLRVEQEVAESRQAAVAAAIELSDLRSALHAMLPAGTTPMTLAGALYVDREAPAVDALHVRAATSRAELRALGASVERTQREAEAARAARRPTPVVTAGLKRADADEGRVRGAVGGLAFNLPLFDTGAREAARWTAERTRIESERAALERRVAGDVTAGHEAVARRRAALAAAASDSAVDELVSAAQVAYREGDLGILAWLDALKVASRAQQRDIELRLDARLAQIALESAVGEEIWR